MNIILDLLFICFFFFFLFKPFEKKKKKLLCFLLKGSIYSLKCVHWRLHGFDSWWLVETLGNYESWEELTFKTCMEMWESRHMCYLPYLDFTRIFFLLLANCHTYTFVCELFSCFFLLVYSKSRCLLCRIYTYLTTM